MKLNNEFLIPYAGFKLGKHPFTFEINKSFFENFEFDDFESCNIEVSLIFEKKSTFLELTFKHKGTVNVPCDITNELFDLPIKGELKLVVKFGDEFNNENEELLILPHGEYQIDVSQYIYEMIVLSVPSKRIHPGVKDGTMQSDVLEKLESLSSNINTQNKESDENTDPRWDSLKKLLTDKKK
ncbi:MAG: YceD family protein [Flavobacterium sp.]